MMMKRLSAILLGNLLLGWFVWYQRPRSFLWPDDCP